MDLRTDQLSAARRLLDDAFGTSGVKTLGYNSRHRSEIEQQIQDFITVSSFDFVSAQIGIFCVPRVLSSHVHFILCLCQLQQFPKGIPLKISNFMSNDGR